MAAYTVVNGTGAELTDVNAGGDDVAAGTVTAGVTLSDAELATLAATNGVAIIQDAPTSAEKDAILSVLVASYAADFSGVTKVEALAAAMASDNTLAREVALAALGLPETGLA